MKKTLIAGGVAALALSATALHAQEVARVLSSVAVIQQVAVPRQVCTTQQVMVEQPKSGAGALLGAVAGGAVGNQIGGGSGRAVATMAGVIGGAMLGNNIEGQPTARMQEQTTCTHQTVYENRTVGYNVTYEYAGKQYQVQTPNDPGPTLRVQVSPVLPAAAPQPAPSLIPSPLPVRPISQEAPGIVVASAAPVVYAAPAFYPAPVFIGASFGHVGVHGGGHGWGHGGGHRGHWR